MQVYSLSHPNLTQPIQASVVAILVRPGSTSILCRIQRKNNIWMSYTPYILFAKIRYYHKEYQIHTMYISTKWNIRNKIIPVEKHFGNKIYHTEKILCGNYTVGEKMKCMLWKWYIFYFALQKHNYLRKYIHNMEKSFLYSFRAFVEG